MFEFAFGQDVEVEKMIADAPGLTLIGPERDCKDRENCLAKRVVAAELTIDETWLETVLFAACYARSAHARFPDHRVRDDRLSRSDSTSRRRRTCCWGQAAYRIAQRS